MDELTPQNPRSIQQMFGKIASQYDLTNTLLSAGVHHFWKKQLVKLSQAKPGNSVLDCATGTGDLAFLFETALQKQGRVIGTDFCLPMLEKARLKAAQKHSKVQFELADTLQLPYFEQEFDITSISFGIRNIRNPTKALEELGRVTRIGGKILILEFGQPKNLWLKKLFGFYSRHILPRLGGWMSGERQAYQYLHRSSEQFPCGEAFLKVAQEVPTLSAPQYHPLWGGIAYLYSFRRVA